MSGSVILLTKPEYTAVAKSDGDLVGVDDNGEQRTVRWTRMSDEYPDVKSNPWPNPNGVSGYCFLDGIRSMRAHICAAVLCGTGHGSLARDAGSTA